MIKLSEIRNEQVRAHYAARPDELYEQMEKLSGILQIPIPICRVSVVAHDAEGRETERYEGFSRTFTRNFFNMMFIQASGTTGVGAGFVDGNITVRTTAGNIIGSFAQTGTANNLITSGFNFQPGTAVVGGATNGIIVGTGIIPENFNSFALASALPHGTAPNTISYQAQSAQVDSWDGSTKKMTATYVRIFNNNSGSSLTITETGIYANFWSSGVGNGPCMFLRDLLAAPVTVVNAGQLTVTYTISMTFPPDVVDYIPFPGILPDVINRQVQANWEQSGRNPKNWRSTEDWQRWSYRNFKQ